MSDTPHEVRIAVSEGTAFVEGSCNACNRFYGPDGLKNHKVIVLGLWSSSVRVCPECAQELLKRLAVRVNQCCDVDMTVVVPDHEHEGDEHPGGIKPGVYHLNHIVEMLRAHKRDPKAIQFLADMLEI